MGIERVGMSGGDFGRATLACRLESCRNSAPLLRGASCQSDHGWMVGDLYCVGSLRLNAGGRLRRRFAASHKSGVGRFEGPGRRAIKALVGDHWNPAFGRGLGDGFPYRRQVVLAEVQTIAAGAGMSDNVHVYVLAVMVGCKRKCAAG